MNTDRIAKSLFTLSVALLAFGYGVIAEHYQLFPMPLMLDARNAAEELLAESGSRLPWYYTKSAQTQRVRVHQPQALAPGLTLVTGLGLNDQIRATAVDGHGREIHSWDIDWFRIWPDPTHLPADQIPKSKAGHLHGVVPMPNGDLVFNFERLGMVRLNVCGDVLWKLPRRTHHSLHLDESGNFWVPARSEKPVQPPNHKPPFSDYSVLEVSPDGRVLSEFSVFDLLTENGLTGLLHMSTLENRVTRVTGDTLHLNDVETFPTSLGDGFFKRGDVMISLRNINAILVFDPSDRRIKFMSVGTVLRQHDPDFVDGNTISVFDNNNLAPDSAGQYSRIVKISAKDGNRHIAFTGTDRQPFFTNIMGKHQWLANGNMLITESTTGRAFEVDADSRIVWEYFNVLGGGIIGLVDEAQRLPIELDERFFKRASSACGSVSARH